MNNQEGKVRTKIINVNSHASAFFPLSIKRSKLSGSCHSISDPYTKLCVPDVVKSIIIKVFNLMSRTDEIRHIEWHEKSKCKSRLHASLYNNKQRWNKDKFRCECKELIDKGVCDKRFIWNPTNCQCEYDKSCDIGEYLNYENCKRRKKLVDKLNEEFTKSNGEAELAKITLAENGNKYKCISFTPCVLLFSIIFAINVEIRTYFVYYKYMNCD